MTDHNTPEAVAKRANQEDPIVMYLIVRESLGMSIGKTAAQCGHAVGMLDRKYDQFCYDEVESKFDPVYGPSNNFWNELPECVKNKIKVWDDWNNNSFRKVVLKADDKEWLKIKSEFSTEDYVLVVDAGLTELVPGSETVIGLWPMRKSEVPRVIKRLQVLS